MTDTPRLALITRDLHDRLSRVNGEAGYHNNFTVERPRLGRKINRRSGLVVVFLGPATGLGDDSALGCSEWRQTFWIMAWLGQSDNDETPLDELEAYIRADIEKALIEDEQSFSRNGLALGTYLEDFTPFDDDQSALSGVIATITIHYRTDLGNPFN